MAARRPTRGKGRGAYGSLRLKKGDAPAPALAEFPGLNDNQRRFLGAYSQLGNITAAAELVGLTRQAHYDWGKASPQYVEAFKAVQGEAVERLEAEARQRAMAGS